MGDRIESEFRPFLGKFGFKNLGGKGRKSWGGNWKGERDI